MNDVPERQQCGTMKRAWTLGQAYAQVSVKYPPSEKLTSLSLIFCVQNSNSDAPSQGQYQGEVNEGFTLDARFMGGTKKTQ